MKKTVLTLLLLAPTLAETLAQHIVFPDYVLDDPRGYYDAPYDRYEAEPDHCTTTGTFLQATDDQRYVQSEASNQVATILNNGEQVSWMNDNRNGEADGLTIRFSIPDGTSARVAVYAGTENIGEIDLSSYWAWMYCAQSGDGSRTYKPEKYSDNNSSTGPIVRMRFDETHKLLNRTIKVGEEFSIRNISDTQVTLDFVEIEKAVKREQPDGSVCFGGGSLADFIHGNKGKTIYIPEGYYEVGSQINLNGSEGTHIVGAGMWYTTIYFNNYNNNCAGFYNNYGNNSIEDLYMNSVQNIRYPGAWYVSNGKGLQGDWGTNSYIKNVWIEHFECGAWIANYETTQYVSNNFNISHCRFRNNYADGINLCKGAHDAVVEHCSFRNNGDDDMASWSADGQRCYNNTYRYNTAEHNWRASSLGFFGGSDNSAHHIVVRDGLESGMRIVSDFGGADFGGTIQLYDISIWHCSCVKGTEGVSGDFWGVDEAALHLEASKNYDIPNLSISNVDIYDSRGNGVYIGSTGHSFSNLSLNNVKVHSAGEYAFYFEYPSGSATLSNLGANDTGVAVSNYSLSPMPSQIYNLSVNGDGVTTSTLGVEAEDVTITAGNGVLVVSGAEGNPLVVADMQGHVVYSTAAASSEMEVGGLSSGLYVVNVAGESKKVMLK